MEEWKDVPGYEGFYQVSNLGSVRSLDRQYKGRWGMMHKKGAVMSLGRDSSGYRFAHLSRSGKSKTPSVHVLVAAAFLGARPDGLVVDHIDGDKENNSAKNLQYISYRENAIKGGLCLMKKGKSSKYAGVSYDKSRKKWRAQARLAGKARCLGRFDSEEEASKAYLNALA